MKLARRGLSAVPAQPLRTDSILIRASVLARVVGLRLLRLEATITVAPAELGAGCAPSVALAEPSLAEAVRGMEEGTELLARARLNGS